MLRSVAASTTSSPPRRARGRVGLVVAALLAGCSGGPPPASPPTEPAPRSGRLTRVRFDRGLASACDAADAEAGFTVDIGFIRPPEGAPLTRLARCLADGPLKGRRIRLVERTTLPWPGRDGARVDALHAFAVRDHLVFHGVARDAVDVVSEPLPVTGGSSVERASYAPRVDVGLLPRPGE
ncbi:MAG: hypothetical protein JNL82_09420 [Myxococcales bacterium]|nr:hypothetical protein [Myxococcales bacterium]